MYNLVIQEEDFATIFVMFLILEYFVTNSEKQTLLQPHEDHYGPVLLRQEQTQGRGYL